MTYIELLSTSLQSNAQITSHSIFVHPDGDHGVENGCVSTLRPHFGQKHIEIY